MTEEELKQISDGIFNKLDEKEKVFLATVHNVKNKEIERLNNIINEAIDKAKTMKASMLLDTIDGIEIDSKFIHDLYVLIDFIEQELKGSDKE